MQVLVTGGAGFIGSHIVDALLARGYLVTALDDLSSGKMSNIKKQLNNPNFRFIQGDIRNPEMVEKALTGVKAVIHEAAIVSVPLSTKDPALVEQVNVQGTLNLLKTSSKQDIERFVYASSCAVYGEQTKLPISEDAPLEPLSPYASSKLAAEQNCQTSYGTEELETVCLRYFNVYGPRQVAGEYAGVMAKFSERLRKDQPPIIYGDGKQTRDFIHVDDVVNATLLALECDRVAGEVINIGTGKATSINELCEIFLRATGKTHFKPKHEAPRVSDIKHSQANIAKVGRLLSFEPSVPLKRGVKKLLEESGL